MIFEDKLIIENALSLWVGCVQYRKELLTEFYEFKQESGSIFNCQQLILSGLLYCNHERVREEFNSALGKISK
jgi:hypothetical protein